MKNTLPQSVDLPIRDGVSASCVQVPAGEWSSLLVFLCAHFSAVSESIWLSRFARGLVLDHTGKSLSAEDTCKTGARIYYYRELTDEQPIPFQETILYQDDCIVVADKPHFLPVIPSGRFVQQTLLVRLKKTTGLQHLSPVHRIDKDTAGLVVFSVNPQYRNAYQALFRERLITKHYHAIARWHAERQYPFRYHSRLVEDKQFFRTCEVQGDSNSGTIVNVIDHNDRHALYDLQPVTGRKHQLRVHMAALGTPILNDVLYPELRKIKCDDFTKPLQLLAKSLSFIDPITQRHHFFESRQQLLLP